MCFDFWHDSPVPKPRRSPPRRVEKVHTQAPPAARVEKVHTQAPPARRVEKVHTQAPPAARVEKPFYIQNPTTGHVLDIRGGDRNWGAQIVMWPYHGGPNQLWVYKNGSIYSKLNGLVLDVSGSDGCSVITYEYHGGANQKWSFKTDGSIQCGTGQVLDIRGSDQSHGAGVIAYAKHGNWNQKFSRFYA